MLGCVPIFNIFSDLLTIVFLDLTKNIVSKHATAWCLYGVKGTSPSSARGVWPHVIMSLDGAGGSIRLSWAVSYSKFSLSLSSCSFFLNSSATFLASSGALSSDSFSNLSSSSFFLWASSPSCFSAYSSRLRASSAHFFVASSCCLCCFVVLLLHLPPMVLFFFLKHLLRAIML